MNNPNYADIQEALGLSNRVIAKELGISSGNWSDIKAGRKWIRGVPAAKQDLVLAMMKRAGMNGSTHELAAESTIQVPEVPVPEVQVPEVQAPVVPEVQVTDPRVTEVQAPDFNVSFGDHSHATKLTPETLSWDSLAGLFEEAEVGRKDGPFIMFGHFEGDRRASINFREAQVFAFDGDRKIDPGTGEVSDGCCHPDGAVGALKAAGLRHFVATTYSHDPARGFYRWRGFIPLSRPYTTKDELKAVNWYVWNLFQQHGQHAALPGESHDVARLWYLPRVHESRQDTYQCDRWDDGRLLDVDAAVAAYDKHVGTPRKTAKGPTPVHGYSSADDCFSWYNQTSGIDGLRNILEQFGYGPAEATDGGYRLESPYDPGANSGVVIFTHHKTGVAMTTSHHVGCGDPLASDDGGAFTPVGALAVLAFEGDYSKVSKWVTRLRKDVENAAKLEMLRTELGDSATALEEFTRMEKDQQTLRRHSIKKATKITTKEEFNDIVNLMDRCLKHKDRVHHTDLVPELDGDGKPVDLESLAPVAVDPVVAFDGAPEGPAAALPDTAFDVNNVAVRWPNGYHVGDEYLTYQPEPTDENPEPRPIRLSTALRVLAMARDPLKRSGWSYVLRFRDRDGMEHRSVVPFSALHGDGATFAGLLTDDGCWLSKEKGAAFKLASGLNDVQVDARMALVKSTGWHAAAGEESASVYVLPNAAFASVVAGDAANAEGVLWAPANGSYSNHKYEKLGTFEEWRAQVPRLAVNNRLVVLSLCAGFAAPLLRLVGASSVAVQFMGDSSSGKSTAHIAAGSIFGGKPSHELGYGHSWDATQVGLELTAASHNDALMILDEMGRANPHTIGGVVYALMSGTGRLRGAGAGGLRDTAEWKTVALSNGEKTLVQMMDEVGQKHAAGMEVRLINLRADIHRYGAFEDMHEFADVEKSAAAEGKNEADGIKDAGEAFAKHLRRVAREEQFGTAIEVYMSQVVEWIRSEVRLKAVRKWCDNWERKHLPEGSGTQLRRIASSIALFAFAGELATSFGVTGWEKDHAADQCAKVLTDITVERGTAGNLEVYDALMHLRRQIDANLRTKFLWLDANYKEVQIPPDMSSSSGQTTVAGSDRDTIDMVTRKVGGRIQGEQWGYVIVTETHSIGGDTSYKKEVLLSGDRWRQFTGDSTGRNTPVAHAARDKGWLVTEKSQSEECTYRRKHPETKERARFYVIDLGALLADDDDPTADDDEG